MMLQTNRSGARHISPVIGALLLTALFSGTALWAQQTSKSPGRKDSNVTSKPISEPSIFPTQASEVNKAGAELIYKVVEQMPAFKGDISSFLENTLIYPESARKQGKEGRSVVQFVVNADGAISDVTLVRTSGTPALDEEALRAVNAMPAWVPGKQAGKPVAVYFTMPIMFALGDDRPAGSNSQTAPAYSTPATK